MRFSCEGVGTIMSKVTSFTSPLTGTITSAQTKTKLQHFPIKSSQQNMVFEIVCTSWDELKKLQDFIRAHQKAAMTTSTRPEINMWWPQRGIENWSGFVEKMQGGDRRFNFVPKVSCEFFLIDSLLSEKTFGSSLASDFSDMLQNDIGHSNLPGTGWADDITPPANGGTTSPILPTLPPSTGGTPNPIGGGLAPNRPSRPVSPGGGT